MNVFEASNGSTIRSSDTGIYIDAVEAGVRIYPGDVDALREFFQHERDEEVGRWRWPKKPEFVVYQKKESEAAPQSGVRVVHETSGRSRDVERLVVDACEATVSVFGQAARAYFEAHPERKPWEDANDGELWLVNGTSVAHVRRCHDGKEAYFEGLNPANRWGHAASHAKSAERIWPATAEEISDIIKRIREGDAS